MPPPPFFKERGEASALRRSGSSSALGGSSSGAGARCALPAPPGGFPGSAPDAFGMSFFFHPGAPAASLPSPSHAPARARNAHDPASLRTHRNARTRSAAAGSPPPRHAPGVSHSGHAGCWCGRSGTLLAASWGFSILGGRRRACLPPLAARLLCFPFSSRGWRRTAGLAAVSVPLRPSPFPGLFRFPSFLSLVPFLPDT